MGRQCGGVVGRERTPISVQHFMTIRAWHKERSCVCALLRGASAGKLQKASEENEEEVHGSFCSMRSHKVPGGGGTNRQSGKVNALQLLIIIMAASCWQL